VIDDDVLAVDVVDARDADLPGPAARMYEFFGTAMSSPGAGSGRRSGTG
jgi:hypothetical protein